MTRITNLADSNGNPAHWWVCLLELECNSTHRAGVYDQAVDSLLWLARGCTDIIELDDHSPELLVSLIDHRGKTNNYHEGNSDLQWICKQCDDTLYTVSSALLEVTAITHGTTTHIANEKLQRGDSFCKHKVQTVHGKPQHRISDFLPLPHYSRMTERESEHENQITSWNSLQEYVLGALWARIRNLFCYLSLTGHPRECWMYDIMRHHFAWPHIPYDVHKKFKDCHSCAQDGS